MSVPSDKLDIPHPDGCSFVVPCFNEQPEVLAETVSRIRDTAQKAGISFEILVIDDASTRHRYEAETVAGVRLFRHRHNRGYGSALATGIDRAAYPWIGIIDSDATYPIEKFSEMLSSRGEYDMVIGARSWGDISRMRSIPKRILTALASFLADYRIPDLNSGMRLFRREIFDNFRRIYPQRFSFSSTLTMVALTSSFDVQFLQIPYFKRQGRSSIHPLRDPLRFLYQLLRLSLYFRPLRFFIPLSVLVGAAAAARGYRDLMVVQHFGGLTIVLFFMAFQIFFFGLIAEIINKK